VTGDYVIQAGKTLYTNTYSSFRGRWGAVLLNARHKVCGSRPNPKVWRTREGAERRAAQINAHGVLRASGAGASVCEVIELDYTDVQRRRKWELAAPKLLAGCRAALAQLDVLIDWGQDPHDDPINGGARDVYNKIVAALREAGEEVPE